MTRAASTKVALAICALLIAAAVLAGCAGEGEQASSGRRANDPGPVHVHALGVDPGDGDLLIATHTGLFRAGPDGSDPERIADRYQDTMGFTVVGPNHFLGSGHPDLREDLPPLLGLIESRDGGLTWRPISLLGEADFHVLRVKGSRVFGYDASNQRIMISADGGRRWHERRPPAALVDMVIDPQDPTVLVASTEAGLVRSADQGRTWQPLAGSPPGLLAWPAATALYLVDGTGSLHTSSDGGRSWSELGRIGGPPAALHASDARTLLAALHDGALRRSEDGGRTWSGLGG